MGFWMGDDSMEGSDPETVVIEIKTGWISEVISLIGRDDANTYLTSLYSHEPFGEEINGNDQGLYEDELRKLIPFNFNKLKKFMELNYPLIWRGHDTFIGDHNEELNDYLINYSADNVWLPLNKKFNGNLGDLLPGLHFIDGDGTMVSHDNYDLSDTCDWNHEWYIPKGLYEIKYLEDLLIIAQQAINYQLLKL